MKDSPWLPMLWYAVGKDFRACKLDSFQTNTKPEDMFQESPSHSNQSWTSRPWNQVAASPRYSPTATMGMSSHQQQTVSLDRFFAIKQQQKLIQTQPSLPGLYECLRAETGSSNLISEFTAQQGSSYSWAGSWYCCNAKEGCWTTLLPFSSSVKTVCPLKIFVPTCISPGRMKGPLIL